MSAPDTVAAVQDKSPAAKKGRKKRDKKQVIELSLWINGVKYEYGLLCTFCAKIQAVLHCPLCTDFYCTQCDYTAHLTKKRKDHVRSTLSKFNLNQAGGIITRTVRRYGLLRLMQRRAREVFRRHFDKKTLNYYYLNKVYMTVSWRKPYCLRKQELFPYMTPEYAASKCQNLYYLWLARKKTRELLLAQYTKIFDRQHQRFYYGFNGPSKLIPRSSWIRPRLLGKRSFPKDILPVYTKDVAAVIIQRKWRTILMYQFLRALCRACHDEVWDPVLGRFNYYNRDHEILYQEKPKILRNEHWDPNRVSDWSIEEVSLFLRRIGLKQYKETMKSYQVDGNALVLLDNEDYENMGILNRVAIRKIRVEIDRIYRPARPVVMTEEHEARREKIRRHKMFMAAALKLQRQFRRYRAQKEAQMLREINRLKRAEERLHRRIEATNFWWTENEKMQITKPGEAAMLSSTGVKLPPIKTFGRRRDYLSHKGWGHKGNDLKGTWLPSLAAVMDKNFMGDTHPTLIFSEKLRIKGYDEKRLVKFLNDES